MGYGKSQKPTILFTIKIYSLRVDPSFRKLALAKGTRALPLFSLYLRFTVAVILFIPLLRPNERFYGIRNFTSEIWKNAIFFTPVEGE